MKQLLLLSGLLGFLPLAAQPYSDCTSALVICNKQAIHLDTLYGAGADNTELNEATCFFNGAPGNLELNSCWIRFTAAQSGTLFFTITPDVPEDDIDFVLYQLEDSSNCQQKLLLRCMAAGDFISSGSPCTGPTGLLPGETDTSEDAGCTDADDNAFLAPVDLVAGETYLLCVQNFTTLNGFRIEFCGTALLGCEIEPCATLTVTHAPVRPAYRLHALYPNPVSTPTIMLDVEMEKAEVMNFTLVNLLGQPVQTMQRFLPDGRHTQELPMEHLPTGAYWLQMTDGRALLTRLIWIRSTED